MNAAPPSVLARLFFSLIDAVGAAVFRSTPGTGRPEGRADEGVQPLHALATGEEAVVVGIGERVHGGQRHRLLDLGVVPGTLVRAELRSPSGDPVAYRIRGAVIALRRAQAEDILVRRRHGEEAA